MAIVITGFFLFAIVYCLGIRGALVLLLLLPVGGFVYMSEVEGPRRAAVAAAYEGLNDAQALNLTYCRLRHPLSECTTGQR